MNRFAVLVVAVAMVVQAFTGCSGKGNPMVQTPALQDSSASLQSNALSYLLGYYDIYIDIPTQTATAVPNRTVMYAVNVVQDLNNLPGNLLIAFNGCYVTSKCVDVDLDLTIKHPLPFNKTEYNIYDVRGIFIGNGSSTMQYNSDLKFAAYQAKDQVMYDYDHITGDPHAGRIGMPDGYTRWWNPPEFTVKGLFGYTQGTLASPGYKGTATLNPYKYFATGLGVTDDCFDFLTYTANHGVLRAGTSCTRNYYLRFPTPTPGTKSNYAIVANWKSKAPADHPANAPEAVAMKCIIAPDLYYVSDSDKGGDIILNLSIFDWDSMVNPFNGTMEDYRIYIESTVLSGVYTADGLDMHAIGSGSNYYTYHLDIPADNITANYGQVWVIVECKDQDYTYQFGSPNLADHDKLAACFRYDLEIASQPVLHHPPVSHLEVDTPMPHLGRGHIYFDALASYDVDVPSGDAITFSWDFNGDGIFDDPYDSGTPGKPMKDYNSDYDGEVSVKVTDMTGLFSVSSKKVNITSLREANIVWGPVACQTVCSDLSVSPDSDSKYYIRNGAPCIIRHNSGGIWLSCTYTHGLGSIDSQGNFIMFSADNHGEGKLGGVTWFANGSWGSEVALGEHPKGVRAVWNQVGGMPIIWALFDFGPDKPAVAMIQSHGFNDYTWPFPFYWETSWYNGAGSQGVVIENLKAADTAPWSPGPYTLYTLESIPINDTGVVEKWTLASPPVYQSSFGQGLLYNPLDMSVDSLGNIYILDLNADGLGIIWVYNSSGALIGTSDPLTDTELIDNPMKLDCCLLPDPDQVMLLSDCPWYEWGGQEVTSFLLEPE